MRAQGRTITTVGGNRQAFYVVSSSAHLDLAYYAQDLGLPFVTPTEPGAGGGYFELMSWERTDA